MFIPTTEKKAGCYTNPVLTGFYPDPAICRVEDDYFLVNSTFAYFPGLPIFHSRDLVSWKLISYAMNRPEQLDLSGLQVSEGLYAPGISYHDGVFYITCTIAGKKGNFVITSNDIRGPWSDPVWLEEVEGIDPSLFFDDDGNTYLAYNSIAPENNPEWDGHRTIRMYAFDHEKLQVKGEQILLVDGGSDKNKKPIWIEGPHIYKRNGWYYLLCAEGGTGYDHSEVVFRCKQVKGPYLPYENNPVLTQRDLDPQRINPVTTAGHADLVETKDNNWYAVFLACRPYDNNHFNTGRETFLLPVTWTEDEWPVILKKGEAINYYYPLPHPAMDAQQLHAGNFHFKTSFSKQVVHDHFIFLRTPTENWYSINQNKGTLSINLRPVMVSEKTNPSFMGYRQQHLRSMAATSIVFHPRSEDEKAGLIAFQNEQHYYYLCLSMKKFRQVVQLYRSSGNEMELMNETFINYNENVQLKIESKGDTYEFAYRLHNEEWKVLEQDVDARFLSTETAGGFVGVVYALYATSLGKRSNTKAYYEFFEYKGDDEVFK